MELGAGEILVILAIVLLLFGPSKLPRLGEGLGTALANFRKALRGDEPKPSGAEDPARRAAALPEPSPKVSRQGETARDGVNARP